MRVLLTTDTVGGVWTFTKELSMGLLERGHAVALVSFGRDPFPTQQAWVSGIEQTYGAAFSHQASNAPLEWMEENRYAYSDGEALLLRVIEHFEVDLLHSSQFCFGALPVDLPKIVTAHSDVLSWAAACRPAGLEESDWLTRYRSLVCAGLSGADRLVAPTHWMLDALSQHFSYSKESRVILNGRDLPRVKESKPGETRAVTVGRVWDEAKGLAVLDEIDASVPIAVVGETRFQGRQAFALNKATLLGTLDERELLELFQSSSLYLATSVYEPFGLAPLEAALCGCGVLARDIPSLREVWGSAAEYFTDGATLSDSISRLHKCAADLAALRARSMLRALEMSADRMVDAYIALYNELLGRGAREEVAAYAR